MSMPKGTAYRQKSEPMPVCPGGARLEKETEKRALLRAQIAEELSRPLSADVQLSEKELKEIRDRVYGAKHWRGLVS